VVVEKVAMVATETRARRLIRISGVVTPFYSRGWLVSQLWMKG
jgi:hypothetical protein